MINVGVDVWGYRPVREVDLVQLVAAGHSASLCRMMGRQLE